MDSPEVTDAGTFESTSWVAGPGVTEILALFATGTPETVALTVRLPAVTPVKLPVKTPNPELLS
jgi:hypothetical protein